MPWHVEPRLWRTWGIAGALASLGFYALEYFPSHMGMRLEVNHPLYALAWFAAGDMMWRASARMAHATKRRRADVAWIFADLVAIGILPAIVALVPSTFVIRPGTLLLNLHEDYITEFLGLAAQIARWNWVQVSVGAGLVAVLVAGPAIALSASRAAARPLRALAIVSLAPAFVFTLLAFYQVRWIGVACGLWLTVLVALTTGVTLGRSAWSASVAQKVFAGIIAFGLCVGLVAATLNHFELTVKDLPTGVVLVVLGAAIALPTAGVLRGWTTPRLVLAGFALAMVFLPAPAVAFQQWRAGNGMYPTKVTELWQLATRDVSRRLRARLGAERGTIVAAPTTSSWMTYFGGFRSLGTLYWENVDGITATASILGALPSGDRSAADSAHTLSEHYGVTHFVFFSWNPFGVDYARLATGQRAPVRGESADPAALKDTFVLQLLNERRIPQWLRPLPYRLPSYPALQQDWIRIFEVVPDQSADEAMVRLAQYHLALDEGPAAATALNAVLDRHPGYLPALIQSARTAASRWKGRGLWRDNAAHSRSNRRRRNTEVRGPGQPGLGVLVCRRHGTRSVRVHQRTGARHGARRTAPPS